MGNNITLRKAEISDAADLAILENIASFGLALWCRKLLDDCFKRARRSHAKNICLVVEDANELALALYRANGFSETDRRACISFSKGVKSKHWLLMHAGL